MKARLDGFSNFIFGCAYNAILVFFMAVILYPQVPVLELLLLSGSVYGLMTLFFLTRVTRILFLGLSGLATVIITFLCWVDTPYSRPVLKIVEGIIELWYRIAYNEPRQGADMMLFTHVFMLFSSIVAALIVILFYKKSFSFFILTGVTFAIALFSYYMTAKESRWLFALFCILTILSYVRLVYIRKKRLGLVAENIPLGNFMLFTIPFALILIMVVSFIPKKEHPIEWPWLDTKIMSVIDTFEQRFSSNNMEFFTLASTGFNSRSQRLGGPIRPNSTVVMEVKADKRTYLRGAAYAVYENNSWGHNALGVYKTGSTEIESDLNETQTGWINIPVDELFPDATDDDKQLLQALSQEDLLELLFPTYSLEIKFRNMTTRTVFLPLKSILPVMLSDNTPLELSQDTHGTAITSPKLPSGSTYKLNYTQPMYGDPLLKKALTFSRRGLYTDARNILMEKYQKLMEEVELQPQPSAYTISGRLTKSDSESTEFDILITTPEIEETVRKMDILSMLEFRASTIASEYTIIDEAVPQRVKDLAKRLTGSCKSDYEKVIAVESYLRKNFSYTYNTSRIPGGRDFVDYFLFEENKGYCTYFSTAMSILLRSLNIPARYVEGYVLPENSNDDNIFIVTNRNAHAWVEVYFEGFGWLIFEPTPAYAGTMDYLAETKSTMGEFYPDMPGLEDLMENYRQDEGPGFYPVGDVQGSQASFGRYAKYIPWILFGLLLLSYIVNLVASWIGNLRMRGLKGGKKVIKLYELMLNWFSHVGTSVRPGETAGEFSKRVDQMYMFSESNFMVVTDIFVKVRYGSYEVSIDELRLMERLARQLRKNIIKELGIKRYMPLRMMILGI